jgi:hypothetical protein
LLAALAVVGCSGSDDPAVAAFKRQLDAVAAADGEAVYTHLHPAQQALITEEKYAECVSNRGPVQVDRVEIEDVATEEITIPGTEETASATVITATLTITSPFDAEQTDEYNEINVDGQWRFTLPEGAMEAYKAGACP